MTDLNAAIADHLTRAQRHWLACQEHGLDDRNEMRYHATGHAYEVSVAWLTLALARLAPDNVEAVLGELDGMLHHAPASAEWVWEELSERGVDVNAIPAFVALKPREEDAHPLRYATTSPDGQAVTGLAADPDRHPEKWCHRCGGPNICWSAPSPLWNQVMRAGDINNVEIHDGIVCPLCFAVLAQEYGIASPLWQLDAKRVLVPLQTVTPSGRTWNPGTWLWDDAPLPPFDATQVREHPDARHPHGPHTWPDDLRRRFEDLCREKKLAEDASQWLRASHAYAGIARCWAESRKLREHPGTGQPMTEVPHPADGTWSPVLSTEQPMEEYLVTKLAAAGNEITALRAEVRSLRPRCCGDHEPTCSITAPGAECCTECPDKNEAGA